MVAHTKARQLFLMGSIGFLSGLLLAPKSGKETRQTIRNKSHDLSDKARQHIEETKEDVRDTVSAVRESGNEIGDTIKEKIRSLHKHGQDEINDAIDR